MSDPGYRVPELIFRDPDFRCVDSRTAVPVALFWHSECHYVPAEHSCRLQPLNVQLEKRDSGIRVLVFHQFWHGQCHFRKVLALCVPKSFAPRSRCVWFVVARFQQLS